LITETNDNQAYDIKISYDNSGNPVTVTGNIFGFTINSAVSYDTRGRLLKITYRPTAYREYVYNDNTFLPAECKVYQPQVNSNSNVIELVEDDLFTYNSTGLMTKYDVLYTNSYQSGEIVWQYAYDSNGNLTTITRPDQSTAVYNATGYDNKPNITGANQWLKYILLDPNNGYNFYYYLLNNTNNATNWTLNDPNASAFNPKILSYYQYNSKGYAIKDSTVFFDPVNGNYTDVQINSFTCK
jgi:YD repeat-containing protein